MDELRISFVQAQLYWEDIDKNFCHFSNLLSEIEPGMTDLIVLPEMFSTGFTMNVVKVAEPEFGRSVAWMKDIAQKLNCSIAGSVITIIDEKYYNRLYVVDENGGIQYYDKHHLFRIANEHKVFSAGDRKLIVNIKGWRVNFLICYDLRFPVWSRNKFNDGIFDYDLLVYVANWPEQRSFAWQTLLPARAIENQSYILGVNRVGCDGNNICYQGDSMLCNFKGENISYAQAHDSKVVHANIYKTPLDEYRRTFAFGLDWDDFELMQEMNEENEDFFPIGRSGKSCALRQAQYKNCE